jgi:hypothetical protein
MPEETELELETPEPTMEEDIASDWAEISKGLAPRDGDRTAARSVEKTAETALDGPKKGVEGAKSADSPVEVPKGQERGPDGKFVKSLPADDGSPRQAKPAEAEVLPESQARDITRAPSTWKPTARAAWATLPDPVRAEIHRRESDFMAGQSQLLPDAKFGSSMRETLRPYDLMLQSEGIAPEQFIADLARTSSILRLGTPVAKLQAIDRVFTRFGIDRGAYARAWLASQGQAAPSPAPSASPPQPSPGATQPQVFRDPRVDQLLEQQQQREAETAQRSHAERLSITNKFIGETGADGQPVRPYINDVLPVMADHIQRIRDENPSLSHGEVLQQAYDRAIWANPEIRQLLIAEQQRTAEAARIAENRQRVGAARRSSSTNVPRRGSTPSAGSPGTMDDTIREEARRLSLIG